MEEKRQISMYMLFKFGEERFMRKFFHEGELFFNTVKFFQEYELDDGRKDKNECLLTKITNSTMYVEDKCISTNANANLFSYVMSPSFNCLTHIYSLTGFYDGHKPYNEKLLFDEKLFELGEYFVQINKPDVFIQRATNKIQSMANLCLVKEFTAGKVLYSDYSSPIISTLRPIENLLCKDVKYEYQSEFRLLLSCRQNKNPFILKIGSVEDIAEMHHVRDFLNVYRQNEKGVFLSKKST